MKESETQDNAELERMMLEKLAQDEVRNKIQDFALSYRELMAYYRCAMMEVATKFNVLNEELSLQYDRNPIESVKTRLKSLDSIVEKASRKGVGISIDSIEKNINDIAGVRVICSYPSDIYMLAESFTEQDDIRVIECKDYIKNPKPNGYRSLHLIVETPIFLHDKKRMMKVEVQFRTISMDWWASLEHKINYKKNVPDDIRAEITKELLECATMGASLDARMEGIQKRVEQEAD